METALAVALVQVVLLDRWMVSSSVQNRTDGVALLVEQKLGKITFEGNRSLDSVFGGRVKDWQSRKVDDTSTDLTPLPQ